MGDEKKDSGILGLLKKPDASKDQKRKNAKEAKVSAESFTLTIKPATIKKFNEIQWLKQYAIDFKRATRNDVLMEALNCLGEKIGYDELMKKYSDKMEGDISPPVGRKAKR